MKVITHTERTHNNGDDSYTTAYIVGDDVDVNVSDSDLFVECAVGGIPVEATDNEIEWENDFRASLAAAGWRINGDIQENLGIITATVVPA